MSSPRHTALIGSAGSGKTQRLLDQALASAASGRRVAITTYTIENRNQLERRIAEAVGTVPPNIDILTWYGFLLHELCRPYQLAFVGDVGVVASVNFKGDPFQYAKKTERRYYLDGHGNVYSDRLSALALACEAASEGCVTRRLASIWDGIYVDEMQDLAGHDFDLLDMLLASPVEVHMVGDPRQHLYAADDSMKNRKYKGPRFVAWLEERADRCAIEWLTDSHRCCQPILDWADALFPQYEPSTSLRDVIDETDGVFVIPRDEVYAYIKRFGAEVTVLRQQRNTDTMGLPSINIGVVKGATYERVVLFGSGPMAKYARGELAVEELRQRSRLYVAVTRARRSVVIVI